MKFFITFFASVHRCLFEMLQSGGDFNKNLKFVDKCVINFSYDKIYDVVWRNNNIF